MGAGHQFFQQELAAANDAMGRSSVRDHSHGVHAKACAITEDIFLQERRKSPAVDKYSRAV